MNKEQPEAIRLAEILQFSITKDIAAELEAAAELRRLHAENEALRAQIGQGVTDGLFESAIEPRPLLYTLSDYHKAMTEGPLHYTWLDKPHRLVYDLIAAVRYYASAPPAPQQKPLTDEQIDRLLPEIVNGGFTVITYGRAVARAIEAAHNIGEKK